MCSHPLPGEERAINKERSRESRRPKWAAESQWQWGSVVDSVYVKACRDELPKQDFSLGWAPVSLSSSAKIGLLLYK